MLGFMQISSSTEKEINIVIKERIWSCNILANIMDRKCTFNDTWQIQIYDKLVYLKNGL